jgi:plastocyanin
MTRLRWLVVLGWLTMRLDAAEAIIEGHVHLPTTASSAMVTERYSVVSTDGVMATNPPLAVVYLEGQFGRTTPTPTVQLLQKDMTFIPALLPIAAGTRVEFPNLDNIYHNVFSYSKPKRFDLGRYRPNEHPVPAQVFERPGLVVVRCDIHEHMRAMILVLETPHFITTDASGNFRLTGLPAGRYVLKAWVSSEKTYERPVELVDGGTLQVAFP